MRDSVWHSLKRGGLHLALVAMMLQALLPAGWMPTTEAGSPLVICTAAGAVHQDGSSKQTPSSGKEHSVCPFAAASIAAPPADFVALPAPTEQGATELSFARRERFAEKPRFVQSNPRAPPTLV